MGLRRLGSLSFLENLKMAGVVQFHAKLFLKVGMIMRQSAFQKRK